MRFEKLSIVTLTSALALLAVIAPLGAHGFSEEGWHAIIRWTARVSVTAFLLAFAARPLRQVWASAASGWMLRNRRYLGVSFGVAHITHLAAIVGLAVQFPEPFRSETSALTLVGGGFCYLMIALMLLTSTDRTAAWLSRKNWRRLHTTGMYTIWGIFVQSYVGRVAVGDSEYASVSGALLGLAGLRLWIYLRGRSRARDSAATAN